MALSQYVDPARTPQRCHDQDMERFYTAAQCPLLDALVNDRHYEGLKATDGTDISSRAKHRAYMREHNLTTIDDFTETWKQQARERERALAGDDPTRAADIAHAWNVSRESKP